MSLGSEHQFDWISSHQVFRKWLNSHGPSILHVHGDAYVSHAADYILRYLYDHREIRDSNRGKRLVVYFRFDKNDDRRNTIVSMLSTLLAQILGQNQKLFMSLQNSFQRMSFHSIELSFIFRLLLFKGGFTNVWCVIDGLNESQDSWTLFLRELSTYASDTERYFKIVFTSTPDPKLLAILSEWPSINLNNNQEYRDTMTRTITSDNDRHVRALLQQRPVHYTYEKEITKRPLACGEDRHWRRLTLNQLRFAELFVETTIQEILGILRPITYRDTFAQILANVPNNKRLWTRKALAWTLHSFRPLSVSELGVALTLQTEESSIKPRNLQGITYQGILSDLEELLRGILTLEHGEITFSHPGTRDFLLNADSNDESVWYNVKAAHREISDFCFSYLSLLQIQDVVTVNCSNSSTNPQESLTCISLNSFRFYATKYRSRHYELIPEHIRPTKSALEFCVNLNSLRVWAKEFRLAWNPFLYVDKGVLPTLALLAGLGLQDLVKK